MVTSNDLSILRQELINIFLFFYHNNIRPNDSLRWENIQQKWMERGFDAEDFERLVSFMIKDGTLSETNGSYFLTEKTLKI